MNKRFIALLIIVLLLITTLISSPIVGYNESSLDPENINSYFLESIDFTYNDLYLTNEEIRIVEKYQKSGLDVAHFEMEFINEIIEYKNEEYRVGFNEYIIEAIEKIYRININKNICDFDEGLNGTISGQYDMIFSIAKNNKREILLDLNETKVYSSTYIYTKDREITSIEDFDGLVLGSEDSASYFGDEFKTSNNITKVYFNDINEGIELLENGEIDGIIAYTNSLLLKNNYIANDMSRFRDNRLLNICTYKNDEDLKILASAFANGINNKLAELIINYREELFQIKLGMGDFFSYEEKSFIELTDIDPINLLAYNNDLNGMLLNADGELKDYSVDIWERVSNYVGWNYNIKYDDDLTFRQAYNKIIEARITQEIDIVFGFDAAMDSMGNIIFLKPYKEENYCIVGDISSEDISGLSDIIKIDIGIVDNQTYIEYLKKEFPNKEFKNYSNFEELLKAYTLGEINYFLVSSKNQFDKLYYSDRMFSLEIKYTFDKTNYISAAVVNDNRGRIIKNIHDKVFSIIDTNDIIEEYQYKIDISQIIENEKIRSNEVKLYYAIGGIVVLLMLLGIYLIKNIALRKQSQKELYIDVLTKIENRKALFEKYGEVIEEDLSLAYIDLNFFKDINDIYGHAAGDEVLKAISRRLTKMEGIKPYRIGGDEFIIVGKDFDEEEIKKVIAVIASPISFANRIIKIDSAIGVLKSSSELNNKTSYLLSLLDFAMYKAKNDKRSNYQFVDRELIDSYNFLLKLEKIIQKPIEESGIVLHYQPIIELKSNTIIRYEALMRMEIEGELFYPNYIIPIFDRLGKIHNLDIYVFEKMIQKISESRLINNKSISSNFSPKSLARLKKEQFDNILEKYNVTRKEFCLEITENVASNIKAYELIQELKNDGYIIALDDFSAGHSSIINLVRFDIDIVKIDKKLIDNIQYSNDFANAKKTNDYKVLKSLIIMMKNLKLRIIVEGVENKEMIELLKELEVDEVQGYYYSKPKTDISLDFKIKV